MLGWHLLRDSEIELTKQLHEAKVSALQTEIDRLKAYIAKCEALIDKERERIDAERERADRTIDGYLQQSGLPAVTRTVIAEHTKEAEKAAIKQKDYLETMAEIFNDTMADMEEHDPPADADSEQPEPQELAASK